MTIPSEPAPPAPGSSSASPAHERHDLYRDLAQAAQEVRLFNRVLAAVHSARDQNELIRTMGFGLKDLLPYERWSRVSLALLDADSRQVEIYQLIGERNNPFWDNIGEGIQAAARDHGVVARYAMGTMRSTVSQEQLIDQAIRDGVAGIALAPADAEALEPAIGRARAAGIPVITFGTPAIEGSAALLDIGTDNLHAGRLAGAALARLLPNGGKVGISVFNTDQINMRQRVQGFRDAIAGTAIEPLPPLAINDNRELGFELGHETLATHPDLAGAFGAASLNGPIWARAVAAQQPGRVKIVGFDLVPATVALLKEGEIHATIAQREYDMGYRSVQILTQMAVHGVEQVLARLPDSRFVDTGVDVVTLEHTPWSTSLAEYLKQRSALSADRATTEAVARHAKPIELLLIGILPEADPAIARRQVDLRSSAFLEHIVATEQSLVVNPSYEPAGNGLPEARARGAQTVVGVPLLADRRVAGVLILESTIANACQPDDLAMLERIANAFAVALENARLFRQALERQRALEEASWRQEQLLQTIMELSSPVAPIVPGILVLPLVGLIDDQRANRFIETLLETIRTRGARVVLVDITGVPVVDSHVANYIIQAAQAARLLGAEMVLVGITPAVAQTIVHLGLNLAQVTSRADLESGFSYALSRLRGRIEYS